MYVIGTAGHVDHGKSALVHALTGIDPDRLQEEKDRGLTIDLGFAWLSLPSGREISIVDVPGHERFIKNMLAGVGGIDLAMLVVAADESVMPQTREHLAILDLLHIERGLAVVTKRDLVDDDMLQLVQLEVEDRLRGTTLEGSPIVAVSAITGEGLPELLRALDEALDTTEPCQDLGRPRLAIDRSFTIAGFGTVVTGTLIDGTLSVGQEVELVLNGKRSRIRGLQRHRRKLEQATPGSRIAVNLGGVSSHEIARGEVMASPGWLRPTQAVDARVRLVDEAPRSVRHNLPVTFHAYTGESPATLRFLEEEELAPGHEAWAQLRLRDPLALVREDRFIIRSSDSTLGGGVVVDVRAQRHRRRHAPTIHRLEVLARGSAAAQLIQMLESQEPATVGSIARSANLPEQEAITLAQTAVEEGTLISLDPPDASAVSASSLLYTLASWSRLSTQAQRLLASFHRQYPLRGGMSREELRSRMGLTGSTGSHTFQHLARTGAFVEEAGLVRLAGHQVATTHEQRRQMDAFVQALERDPFDPPPQLDPSLLHLLLEEGRVEKASNEVMFATTVYQDMVDAVVRHLKAQGKVTVAQARDILDTSRKYALALLEHMDEQHITRRVGDERTLITR